MTFAVYGIVIGVFYICITHTQAAGCNAWTGASNATALIANEHENLTGLALVMPDSQYQITCTCGIVTRWQFYARKSGTVILYVLDASYTPIGSTSVNIPALSADNYFEVPVSRDMWISVKSADSPYLAFYTPGVPMITYNTTSYTSRYSSGITPGSPTAFDVTGNTDRQYAIGAYVEEGHTPMFLNLPYTTTLYSHNIGPILTVQATDIDPDDVNNLVYSSASVNTSYFNFDNNTRVLSYDSPYDTSTPGTFTMQITVSDGCKSATQSISVTIVNEGPRFRNLPFSTTVAEDRTTAFTYTIETFDPSGDTVTCFEQSVNPAGGSSIFSVLNNEIIQKASPGFDYDTAKYYDVRIRCDDTAGNSIYSNYQFDIEKNRPPYYNPGSGYLPASKAVSSDANINIYTLSITDPEGDAVSISSFSCSGTCPFTYTGTAISTTSTLTEEGYDIAITISDGRNTVGPYTLSVLVSVDPRSAAVNDAPEFTNLPATGTATIHVMENTASGTYLYKLSHKDKNPSNTFTYTKTVDTTSSWFTFDSATRIITTGSTAINFESGSKPANPRMDIELDDGTATATYTVSFIIEDVNESPTLTAGATTLSLEERDSVFPSPALNFVDGDAGDSATWSMSCGDDSKFFYLNSSDLKVYLAREYDMDTGLSGTATCVVTATDSGGLSASETLTLSVTNINDNTPKFPYNVYTFVLSSTATFLTPVTNLSASDADSDSSGLSGGLTYNIAVHSGSTAGIIYTNPDTYFQIDTVGVLYVRDFSSLTAGNIVVFEVTAKDSGTNPGPLTGTCTITIILSTVQVITTTTTERNEVFTDDYLNPVWLLLVGLVLFAVVVVVIFIVWNDPKFQEWKTYKMFRLSEICRTKPKEPRRAAVHPAKLTVTVNNKILESDPDNAMPWELLAKDANVPGINEVQERIQRQKEKQDREYIKSGLPVFEKGKGARPPSPPRQGSASPPKYATMNGHQGDGGKNVDEDDGGEGQWGNLQEKRVLRHGSPKVVYPIDLEGAVGGVDDVEESSHLPSTSNGRVKDNNSRTQSHALGQLNDF